MNNSEIKIRNELVKISDKRYKIYQLRVVPGLDPDKVIRVKFPDAKKILKKLSADEKSEFLAELPHGFYEEDYLKSLRYKN